MLCVYIRMKLFGYLSLLLKHDCFHGPCIVPRCPKVRSTKKKTKSRKVNFQLSHRRGRRACWQRKGTFSWLYSPDNSAADTGNGAKPGSAGRLGGGSQFQANTIYPITLPKNSNSGA